MRREGEKQRESKRMSTFWVGKGLIRLFLDFRSNYSFLPKTPQPFLCLTSTRPTPLYPNAVQPTTEIRSAAKPGTEQWRRASFPTITNSSATRVSYLWSNAGRGCENTILNQTEEKRTTLKWNRRYHNSGCGFVKREKETTQELQDISVANSHGQDNITALLVNTIKKEYDQYSVSAQRFAPT